MSLFNNEKAYLTKQTPNRLVHYGIFLPVLLAALFPFFYRIHRGDTFIVAGMAVLIVGAFWIIQLHTVYVAIQSSHREWHDSIPDEMLGTGNNWQIIRSKFLAVMAHRWLWHLLASVVLGGLALAIAGFITRIPLVERTVDFGGGTQTQWYPMLLSLSKGILRDYVVMTVHQPLGWMSYIPHPLAMLVAGLFLLMTNLASMTLSIAIGLALGRVQGITRPMAVRVSLGIIGLLIFGSMFTLRGTVMDDTFRLMYRDHCGPQVAPFSSWDCDKIKRDTVLLRIVETAEQVGMVFIDGGASSSAIFLSDDPAPSGYMSDEWVPLSYRPYGQIPLYVIRHSLILLTASSIQLALTVGFLLMATTSLSTKKKSIST